MMTDAEIRDTLRQMLKDWDAATPQQRQAALASASEAAEAAEANWPGLHDCTICARPVFQGERADNYGGGVAHYDCAAQKWAGDLNQRCQAAARKRDHVGTRPEAAIRGGTSNG